MTRLGLALALAGCAGSRTDAPDAPLAWRVVPRPSASHDAGAARVAPAVTLVMEPAADSPAREMLICETPRAGMGVGDVSVLCVKLSPEALRPHRVRAAPGPDVSILGEKEFVMRPGEARWIPFRTRRAGESGLTLEAHRTEVAGGKD